MSTLHAASRQWASRPDDERFCSLDELVAHTAHQRQISKPISISSRRLQAQPVIDQAGENARDQLVVIDQETEQATAPTHWAFSQLAARVKAPADYLRSLPAEIAADALNWGLYRREVESIGCLLRADGPVPQLAAVTGPNYGRVWNNQLAVALRERFGDGVTSDFRVPGEFGKALKAVTKDNTTIYAGDRDMFVFLADETNRIDVPGRRNGQSGEMARGFFVWNSEVGGARFGVATFLFDFVCMNRIVWGAEGYEEIRVRHDSAGPDKWIEQVAPAIEAYAHKSTISITDAIAAAKAKRLERDSVEDFLRQRFTKGQAKGIMLAHMADEDRPIESLWDATVGATAYARGIKYQNERVAIERKAGQIMALGTGKRQREPQLIAA